LRLKTAVSGSYLDMSLTSPQQVVVMEFGKWHDTTDFCPHQLVTDLLGICYGETTGKLV